MADDHDGRSDDFLTRHLPGDSAAVRKLRSAILDFNLWHRQANGRIHCVLITGETGTGKYRLAKLLVQHADWARQGGGGVPSPEALARATANLAQVLLTAVPDSLAESELFGHVKGAFTGAIKLHKGVFGDENVSNVLLDEIGDASLALQGKLLQVIEYGTFRRLGDDPSAVHQTPARILLATRAGLPDLVSSGKFREDLYWRIMPFRMHLPALRERTDEIPELLRRMIEEHVKGLPLDALGVPERPELTVSDTAFAERHHWPGNLRQMSDALLAWLIRGCKDTFQSVVESGPQSPLAAATGDIADIVKGRLQAVLDGSRPPYKKLGEVWQEIDQEVKDALSDLCGENKPFDGGALGKIITEQKLTNIRSQLSGLRSPDQKGEK